MERTNTAIKTKSDNQQTRGAESVKTKTELNRGAVLSMSAIGGLIGLWSVACVVGGLVASGGPLSFVKSYFSAVTGM